MASSQSVCEYRECTHGRAGHASRMTAVARFQGRNQWLLLAGNVRPRIATSRAHSRGVAKLRPRLLVSSSREPDLRLALDASALHSSLEFR